MHGTGVNVIMERSEEELMEELKALNHALESRRKVHAAPRLPLLSKTTSFGSK